MPGSVRESNVKQFIWFVLFSGAVLQSTQLLSQSVVPGSRSDLCEQGIDLLVEKDIGSSVPLTLESRELVSVKRAGCLAQLEVAGRRESEGLEEAYKITREERFKFSYLLANLGEVVLEYGIPNQMVGLEMGSADLVEGGLFGLRGRTSGAVRWLKDYEGRYEAVQQSEAIRYRVLATDRGVAEVRDILFSGKTAYAPNVLRFTDSSQLEALSVIPLDRGSFDPITFLRVVLSDFKRNKACWKVEQRYKVFDGKRRYLVSSKPSSLGESSSDYVQRLNKRSTDKGQILEPKITDIGVLAENSSFKEQSGDSQVTVESKLSRIGADFSSVFESSCKFAVENLVEEVRGKTDFQKRGFWPFNQKRLEIDIDMYYRLPEDVVGFSGFRLDGPLGSIRGFKVE